MKKSLLTAVIFSCIMLPVSLMASAIYVLDGDWTDTRSTSVGGVIGHGGWDGVGDNGFQIGWEISYDDSSGVYSYSYSFSGVGGLDLSKSLSHWNLEVTNPAASGDFFNLSEDFTVGPVLMTVPSSGNPSMPAAIYGIRWETPDDVDRVNWTVSFDSWRAPVWGDFYAKDGIDGGVLSVAWNTGFGVDPTDTTTDFTDWIARPNGTPIPEPATLLLFGAGIAGLAGLRLRRKNL